MQLMIIAGGCLNWQSNMTARLDFEDGHLDLIEGKIVNSLGERPGRELRVNRSTASKYLHVLKAKKRVTFRQVGPVKLWSLEGSR